MIFKIILKYSLYSSNFDVFCWLTALTIIRLPVTHWITNTINVSFFNLSVFVWTQLKWLDFLGQDDSIFSLSAPREKNWVILTLKVESWRNQNSIQLFRPKLSHFELKCWVTGGTKIWQIVESLAELKFDLKSWITGVIIIRPGEVNNWTIFESIGLSVLSKFDLSKFDSQCWANLTLNVESIRLSMFSQLDSQCWVNLTLNVEPIRLSMLSQFDSQCWAN